MTGDRWEIVSGWLSEWIAADPNRREDLRARLAAAHPDLLAEAEELARAAGALSGFLDTPALVREASALAAADRLLSAGSEIGPYRIVSLVGRGGTGDVYRATDVRLSRDVALKVLAPDRTADPRRLERFFREARITASLDHPHIVRVYDVGHGGGHAYLAAELLEGETLRARIARGALPVNEALRIALEIASALAAAHAAGLVHRDLKPDNIFLTRAGATKVLDFGIAKLAPDDAARDESLTMTGFVLGTAGYLAPEQIRNSSVDPRADLFVLGVLLFEMLTGVRAFEREHLVDTLHAILHDPPSDALRTRADVPSDVVDVVMRLLEKSPEARFQSAQDVIAALQRVAGLNNGRHPGSGKTSVRRRLAVLVLVVVAVIATATTWLPSPPTPALPSPPKPAVSTTAVRRAPSEEAQAKVRRGRAAAVGRSEPDDLKKAEPYFLEATKLEPMYAEAWAGLASVYKRFANSRTGSALIYMEKARDAAMIALALDKTNVDAISTLGTVAAWYDWDYDHAEKLLKRALEINPNHSDSRTFLSNLYLNQGRYDDALIENKLAQGADPQSAHSRALEGLWLLYAGRAEEALQVLNEAHKLDPDSWTTETYMANALQKLGRTQEALSVIDSVLERHHSKKRISMAHVSRGISLVRLNRRKEAEDVLRQLPQDEDILRATLLHALGRDDEAIRALKAAVDQKSPNVISLGVNPRFDGLRARKDFRAIMQQLNLLSVSDQRR